MSDSKDSAWLHPYSLTRCSRWIVKPIKVLLSTIYTTSKHALTHKKVGNLWTPSKILKRSNQRINVDALDVTWSCGSIQGVALAVTRSCRRIQGVTLDVTLSCNRIRDVARAVTGPGTLRSFKAVAGTVTLQSSLQGPGSATKLRRWSCARNANLLLDIMCVLAISKMETDT